jgi:Ca2+-binding RTX toxin-like protein
MKNTDMKHSEVRQSLSDLGIQSIEPNSTHLQTSAAAVDKITGSGQVALVTKSGFGVTLDLNNSGADQAIGSFGNDTLTGTSGEDWLTGGAGADCFNAGAGADLLIIDAGAGIDTVLMADDRGVFLNLAKTHSEVVYGDDLFDGGADKSFVVKMMTRGNVANAIVR